MRSSMMAGMIALVFAAAPAIAQQAPVGAEIKASEPGKVAMARAVKASALVTAIDAASRTLTLKGPEGRLFELVAGDEVRNFDQIKVGDSVVVTYMRGLTMEVKKGGGIRESTDKTDAARAKPGEKPAGAVGRQVTVVADVVAVDQKKKTITLKGPKGNVVELDVQNPDHFKVVKKGDQVLVDYVEAVAVSVEPAPKKGAKK
jgi:hypothetical protein